MFLPYVHGLTAVQTGVYISCLSSAMYLFLRQRIKKNILVSLSKYAGTTQRVTGYSNKNISVTQNYGFMAVKRTGPPWMIEPSATYFVIIDACNICETDSAT